MLRDQALTHEVYFLGKGFIEMVIEGYEAFDLKGWTSI
jgi:hypothetical protein